MKTASEGAQAMTRRFALIGCGRAGGSLAWALLTERYELGSVLCSSTRRTQEALEFLGSGSAGGDPAATVRSAPLRRRRPTCSL